MGTRVFRNIRKGLQLCKQAKETYSEFHTTTKLNINPNNVDEIKIPVPWGHIAGKWWGDKTKQPILALHGWQDNAGTFDPLLELLPESFSVLAVDDPGHGFSSHYPDGMLYNRANYIIMCRRIQNHFKWSEPMTILGHSEGGIVALLFSSIYPEHINTLIMIDVIKPFSLSKRFESKFGEYIDSVVVNMTRNADENLKYSLEEIEERWIKGTRGSLTSGAVKILMRRGIKLDSESGKYSLARDPKVKIWNLHYFDENQALVVASNIKCNLLAIRFTEGKFFDASLKNAPHYLRTLEEAAKSFKVVTVEGTHHTHLNHPESVAPIITEFLENIN